MFLLIYQLQLQYINSETKSLFLLCKQLQRLKCLGPSHREADVLANLAVYLPPLYPPDVYPPMKQIKVARGAFIRRRQSNLRLTFSPETPEIFGPCSFGLWRHLSRRLSHTSLSSAPIPDKLRREASYRAAHHELRGRRRFLRLRRFVFQFISASKRLFPAANVC